MGGHAHPPLQRRHPGRHRQVSVGGRGVARARWRHARGEGNAAVPHPQTRSPPPVVVPSEERTLLHVRVELAAQLAEAVSFLHGSDVRV